MLTHSKTSLRAAGMLVVMLVVAMPAVAQRSFSVPTDQSGTVPPDTSPAVVRAMNVVLDTTQLVEQSRSLRLSIFDGRTLELELDRVDTIPGRGLVWYGKVAKEPHSSAILALVGNTVSGNIDTEAGKAYQIRYVGDNVHSFREIDRTKFPDEALPRPSGIKPGPVSFDTDVCASDPRTDIDAMVVYTPAARGASGGQDAMDGNIYLAVAETNQSYLNSNITQRLRLVHTEEVPYTESGLIGDDLTNLTNGTLSQVQTLRDTFAADTVTLVTEYNASAGQPCGQGNFMRQVSHAFESMAYSVVKRDCMTGSFSFAHELGHNMGADHDAASKLGGGAYAYNYAFVKASPSAGAPWRTIMANQTSPPTARVQYWSNPYVNDPVGGQAMGDAAADNHQVLNDTALTVANFRCSSPGVPNVWMKDTWNDTGLEPDPRTAREDMWKSPYIWVRNAQDTGLIHQHQHENPVQGSSNWVYVKMHNGGATAASGNLEVYWAHASTSLTWPAGWTLLSSIPVTAFAAKSTKIVEVPWSSLPGGGHYCVVARWVSASDPMATAEGPDINANVRVNNNLVWRNLHILELLKEQSVVASVEIMNPDRGSDVIGSLVVRAPSLPGKASFLASGQVSVEFDDVLMRAWQAGGARGRGFRREGDQLIVSADGATFEKLILAYPRRGQLKLTFRRMSATPGQEYIVDLEQQRPTLVAKMRKLSEVVGGVSYEIHTDRDYIRR